MSTLRIAVVHYHLRPGGVTHVISLAKDALERRGMRVAVLTGMPPAQAPPSLRDAHMVEGLGYGQDCPRQPHQDPATLLERLRKTARDALGGEPDVWHFHNHSLGKNPALTAAIPRLASLGARLLLQIHDFPEDGRPNNYRALADQLADGDAKRLGAWLYPAAPQIHYATLNERDRDFLRAASLPDERVHLLSNPVALDAMRSDMATASPASGIRRYAYPTRAIRRKNIGEFLLFAALSGQDKWFDLTLAPTTPADRVPYEEWIRFSQQERLPVDFEVGAKTTSSIFDLLRRAAAVCTTSVAEGFGLAFLEPWLAHRPLIGRDLPEITQEFVRQGLRFKNLYTRLDIPADWLPMNDWRTAVGKGLRQAYTAYGRSLSDDAVERSCAAAMRDGCVDFGHLNEELQRVVIMRVRQDAAARDHLRRGVWPPCPQPEEDIAHNEKIVRASYHPDAYALRLGDIYAALLEEKPAAVERVPANRVLDAFLSPERFLLLRT